jgi:hypothetical protein
MSKGNNFEPLFDQSWPFHYHFSTKLEHFDFLSIILTNFWPVSTNISPFMIEVNYFQPLFDFHNFWKIIDYFWPPVFTIFEKRWPFWIAFRSKLSIFLPIFNKSRSFFISFGQSLPFLTTFQPNLNIFTIFQQFWQILNHFQPTLQDLQPKSTIFNHFLTKAYHFQPFSDQL